MDLVSRHLLQQDSFDEMAGKHINSTDPSDGAVTYRGFEFGVAVVMVMALGSCCLVTCCNCMRLGATILMGYGSRNDPGGHPEQPVARQRNERPVVVHHEWDPSDPADPVFIVLPDGGLSLAYQQPTSPSQKSIALTDRTSPASPRSRAFCRLPPVPASIRSCVCAPSAAQRAFSADSGSPRRADSQIDPNSSQDLPRGSPQPMTLAQAAAAGIGRRADRRSRRRSSSAHGRRRSRSSHDPSRQDACRGGAGRSVEYCEVPLDGAVLAQSLADTAAVVARGAADAAAAAKEAVPSAGGAPWCAIAVLLEGDDSDSEGSEAVAVVQTGAAAAGGVVAVKVDAGAALGEEAGDAGEVESPHRGEGSDGGAGAAGSLGVASSSTPEVPHSQSGGLRSQSGGESESGEDGGDGRPAWAQGPAPAGPAPGEPR